jgi:hypothetical protein
MKSIFWLFLSLLVLSVPANVHAGVATAYALVNKDDGRATNPVTDSGPTFASATDFGTSSGSGGVAVASATSIAAGSTVYENYWILRGATDADARYTGGGFIGAIGNSAETVSQWNDEVLFTGSNLPSSVRLHFYTTGELAVDVLNDSGEFGVAARASAEVFLQWFTNQAHVFQYVIETAVPGVTQASAIGFTESALQPGGTFFGMGFVDVPLFSTDDPLQRYAVLDLVAKTKSVADIRTFTAFGALVPEEAHVSATSTADFLDTFGIQGFTLLDGTPLSEAGISYRFASDTGPQAVPEPHSFLSFVFTGIAGLMYWRPRKGV